MRRFFSAIQNQQERRLCMDLQEEPQTTATEFAPPKSTCIARFRGWIPTVSGRLSFSLFGATTHPSEAITANVSDRDTRYVISYQQRYLLDAVLSRRLASLIFGLKGEFWAACLGKASNNPAIPSEHMEGYLFLFRKKWDAAHALLEADQVQLQGLQPVAAGKLESAFDARFTDLGFALLKESIFAAHFRLDRDGEVTLAIPALNTLSDDAPSFPHKDKEHYLHLVSSQLFFFLKDIAHHHQHHDPHTDTLVDLHHFDTKDDYSWRCETLRGLYRKILEFKRLRSESVCRSARGVLVYARSFKSLSEKKVGQIEPELQLELLEQSIAARQERLQQDVNADLRRSENFRNIFLLVLGTILPIVGLLQLSDKRFAPSPLLEVTGELFLANPYIILTAFLLVLVLLLYGARVLDFANSRAIRKAYRVLQAFSKFISGPLTIGAGLWLGYSTYRFVTSDFKFSDVLDTVQAWIETVRNIL